MGHQKSNLARVDSAAHMTSMRSPYTARRLIDARQASKILGFSESKLAHLRRDNRGPLDIKVGDSVRYFEDSVREYAESVNVAAAEDRDLKSAEVAALLAISVQTLCDLRASKNGPRYRMAGRNPVYRLRDVETFLHDCVRRASQR
jgi:predicted DNA-binding transcriptional regulator AlpA